MAGLKNQNKMKKEILDGDVFYASWKDYQNKDNHCFEGLLIAVIVNDKLIFLDAYWSAFGGNGGKQFTIDQAEKEFNLTYYTNINEYDLTKPIDNPYKRYSEGDVLYMHRQHACAGSCKYYYLRKGAKPSKVTMLHALNKKLEEKTRLLNVSIPWDIECINRDIQRVHNGEEVYI